MTAFLRATTMHRILIGVLVLFSVNSLCTSALGALSGMDWAASTTQVKVQVVISIIGNWTGVLLAFFRTSLSKIFKGESPLVETTPPFPPTPAERSGTFDKLP